MAGWIAIRRRASAASWTSSGAPADFAPDHEDVAAQERKVPQNRLRPGRQEDEPTAAGAPPSLEGAPGDVSLDRDMLEIIHARAAEMAVGDRKAGRLDDVGGHPETGAGAQHRAGVLGDVRLIEREPKRRGGGIHRVSF